MNIFVIMCDLKYRKMFKSNQERNIVERVQGLCNWMTCCMPPLVRVFWRMGERALLWGYFLCVSQSAEIIFQWHLIKKEISMCECMGFVIEWDAACHQYGQKWDLKRNLTKKEILVGLLGFVMEGIPPIWTEVISKRNLTKKRKY